MSDSSFQWNLEKNRSNIKKHGVSFEVAQQAFFDPMRVIVRDDAHSTDSEERFYCLGKVANQVLTVRFTYRDGTIRIIGAGYWREGKLRYEETNQAK